jgi:uncharacterized protein with HEPN domain
MAMTRHDPLVYLLHMRDDARAALDMMQGKTRADLNEKMLSYAVTFLVGRIDVTATKVPPSVREAYSDIPWGDILGIRDRILASEGARNDDLVWETICVLPDLLPALEASIEDLKKVGDRY